MYEQQLCELKGGRKLQIYHVISTL